MSTNIREYSTDLNLSTSICIMRPQFTKTKQISLQSAEHRVRQKDCRISNLSRSSSFLSSLSFSRSLSLSSSRSLSRSLSRSRSLSLSRSRSASLSFSFSRSRSGLGHTGKEGGVRCRRFQSCGEVSVGAGRSRPNKPPVKQAIQGYTCYGHL